MSSHHHHRYHRLAILVFVVLIFVLTTNGHEKWDNPNKPPHTDIDPVIEFPDNDPDYVPGDFDRENLTVEELGHYLNHNLVTNMAHNTLLTAEIMRKMRESIRDGSYIGKGPK